MTRTKGASKWVTRREYQYGWPGAEEGEIFIIQDNHEDYGEQLTRTFTRKGANIRVTRKGRLPVLGLDRVGDKLVSRNGAWARGGGGHDNLPTRKG